MRRLGVNTVFAALKGDRPLGLLALMPEGVIAMVYVRPEARRQGVARALMDAALDVAHRRHLPDVRLNVSHANAGALTFYTGMGFRPTGQDATQTFMALTL
nr:GNAT family N-acetyltransferase [Falsirhodobacter halotolerans]